MFGLLSAAFVYLVGFLYYLCDGIILTSSGKDIKWKVRFGVAHKTWNSVYRIRMKLLKAKRHAHIYVRRTLCGKSNRAYTGTRKRRKKRILVHNSVASCIVLSLYVSICSVYVAMFGRGWRCDGAMKTSRGQLCLCYYIYSVFMRSTRFLCNRQWQSAEGKRHKYHCIVGLVWIRCFFSISFSLDLFPSFKLETGDVLTFSGLPVVIAPFHFGAKRVYCLNNFTTE